MIAPGGNDANSVQGSMSSPLTSKGMPLLPPQQPQSQLQQEQQQQPQEKKEGGLKGNLPLSSMLSQKISLTVSQRKRDMLAGAISQDNGTNYAMPLTSFPIIASSSTSSMAKDAPLLVSQKRSFFSFGAVTPQGPLVHSAASTPSSTASVATPKTPLTAPSQLPAMPVVASSGVSVIPPVTTPRLPVVTGDNKSLPKPSPCPQTAPEPSQAADTQKLNELFKEYTESFSKFKADCLKSLSTADGGLGTNEFSALLCAYKLEEQQSNISAELSLLSTKKK